MTAAHRDESRALVVEDHWRRRVLRDLGMAVAIVVCGGAIFIATDATERVTRALLHWEWVQLDDVLLTLALALTMAGWFAFRRWHDGRMQLSMLRHNAGELALYSRRLEELSSQLLQAEDSEQTRLADLLHDEIGQTLFACRLKLELASGAADDAERQALLADAHALASDALLRARDLSMQLHPPLLHDLGLAAALESLLPRLEQRYRLRTQLGASPAWERVPPAARSSIYRSIQELIVNAAKHARASCVSVSAELAERGVVRIAVSDDGLGLPRQNTGAAGFGLFSIERRMACLSGALQVRSVPNRGTTAILEVPGAP